MSLHQLLQVLQGDPKHFCSSVSWQETSSSSNFDPMQDFHPSLQGEASKDATSRFLLNICNVVRGTLQALAVFRLPIFFYLTAIIAFSVLLEPNFFLMFFGEYLGFNRRILTNKMNQQNRLINKIRCFPIYFFFTCHFSNQKIVGNRQREYFFR